LYSVIYIERTSALNIGFLPIFYKYISGIKESQVFFVKIHKNVLQKTNTPMTLKQTMQP